MAESFEGAVRIVGDDGILLTVGSAALASDPANGTWRGTLQTLKGTGVAGKALVVELEIPGDGKGRAQLTPNGLNGDLAISHVAGLGPQPF
jgi:hypothetical protein